MSKRISQLPAAAALSGAELVEVSQLSASVTISGTTISAQASDNSFNDSAAGFVAAGFTTGKAVKVTGFTGNVANNIVSGIVTSVAAGKLTIGGTDGDVIVDDAAGESVTITQWNSGRSTAQSVADLSGGGAGLGWFDVTAYGATGDGTTDDTAAIQSAIDAAAASNNGGVVYFPPGIYIVGGALQDASYSNCQLRLPALSLTAAEQLSIEFRGAYAPPNSIAVGATITMPTNHSIIKGTLNSGSGGKLIGGQGATGGFTNILARMTNITVRMPSNPVLTAVDFSGMVGCELDNVVIDVGTYSLPSVTQPTTTTSYGLKLPGNSNGAMVRLGTVMVCGFYTGIKIGEHTVGHNVSAWGCIRALETIATYHASHFNRFMTVHCPRGIVATGGEHRINISQFDIEHAASGWMAPVYDVDDASNYLSGALCWHLVTSGGGIDYAFNRNGGTHLKCKNVNGGRTQYTYAATLTINLDVGDVVDVTLAGNPTINFSGGSDGDKLVLRLKQDATGSRTVTWGSMVRFGTDVPSPILTSTANKTDAIGLIYNAAASKYDVVAVAKGY